jgi:hypothetical protein
VYTGSLNEELGSADFDDIFSMEFYGAQAAGAYDLTGTNYADCPQCVVVWQDSADDPAATPKIFFQDTGEMTIEEFTATAQGGIGQKSKGVLKDVRLIEVTIDGATYTSTPVPGGACLLLEEGAWDTM